MRAVDFALSAMNFAMLDKVQVFRELLGKFSLAINLILRIAYCLRAFLIITSLPLGRSAYGVSLARRGHL